MSSPSTVAPGLRHWKSVAAAALLLAFAALLFTRLGHYALWDDEANTAIFAANLWSSGDLDGWDGTNIVAFREGLELTGTKNRVYPPFQYVWASPSLGLLGRNPVAARLPFALAALAGCALLVWWLWRASAGPLTWALMAMALLGNVSLILYSRQSRYYALAWALSVGLAYLYVHRDSLRWGRRAFTLGCVLLLAVHYLTYGATMAVLAADYVLFEVWRKKDTVKQVAAFLGTQALLGGALVSQFYPFGRAVTPYVPQSWVADKLKLWGWNLRELNACEFFLLPLLGVALLVFLLGKRRDTWLLRAVVALVLYALVAGVLSPQPVGWASVSDIRYMMAAIPLCIFIAVRTLSFRPADTSAAPAPPRSAASTAVVLALGAFIFLTSVPHAWYARATGAPTQPPYRSTLWAFLQELRHPPAQGYRAAVDYLKAHSSPGQTVFVLPDFGVYPMMFHLPQLRYMWQFSEGKRAAFPMLPDWHFRFRGIPDWMVAFGGDVGHIRNLVRQMEASGIRYEPEVRLGVFGPDRTRPELFWRVFATAPVGNPDGDDTYVFRRVP